MFSRLATFCLFAWSALQASAATTILAPGTNFWWVASSANLFSWTCGSQYNDGYTNFTVLLNNASPTVFQGPQAIIAIQWDYDCSVDIPASTFANIPAGQGYTLLFSDVYNQSHVLASSSTFEIKPVGSAYAPQPSGVSAPTVTANATGTATGSSPSNTSKKSGAIEQHPAIVGVTSIVMALVGAAMMM